MANNLKKTDVVIVGMGASGGVAALPLAQAGLNVIGIEAGNWMSGTDFPPDELRNNLRGWPQAVQKTAGEIPTYRPNESAKTSRANTAPMMNGVGGSSLHYWAQSWRLNPWDFKVVSETTRKYGTGRIPKGSTVEDWPISYNDIESYYNIVETEIGVSGKAGNILNKIDKAGNIFEGPRTKDFPMPPLRSSGFTELMSKAASKTGWNPFPGPAAINSVPYDGRAPCMYHGFCNRGGCPVHAKNSTAVTTIPKAISTGKLSIVAQARVTKIEVDESTGKATGVTYVRGGQEYFQPADVVLIASHVFEVVRLMLNSKSKVFPDGISNNQRQVGKHYFCHADQGAVYALFPFDLNNWYGLPGQSAVVDDFADDNFDHSSLDFIGGGTLTVFPQARPIFAGRVSTFFKNAPQWGSKWKEYVSVNASRWATGYVQSTTLPNESTYLDLDPAEKDSMGMPVIRVTGDFQNNDRKANAFAKEKMEKWFLEAGAIMVQKQALEDMAPSGSTTHHFGGTRMGLNPKTNVVNQWGMSHEVPNLGVLGGSVMGTSGARNPTLTVQALAWRTAEHIAKNWNSIVK